MRATFGISALVNTGQFYRQLRLVTLKVSNKEVEYPYEFEINKDTAIFGVSAYFVMDSVQVDIKPRQLVGTPRIICPLIEGVVTGYNVTNVRWYNDNTLEFLAYSYQIKPDERGVIQFQRVIGSDGATRWTNPAL